MNERTRTGLAAGVAALLLGVAGDLLLRAAPWGVNVLLWSVALVAAVVLIGARTRSEGRRVPIMPLAGAVGFAACIAWRDSPTLKALCAAAAVVCLSVAAWPQAGVHPRWSRFLDYGHAVLAGVGGALAGLLPLVVLDIRWRQVAEPGGAWTARAVAVARGVLLAAPLVLLFGALFASADSVFAHLVSRCFDIDPAAAASHLAVFAGCAWLAGGYLRAALLRAEPDPVPPMAGAGRARLGAVESATALGLVDLLFLAFVLVQLRYFFGGAALVRATTCMTYAAYARRGFFELVTVAALCLPMLLAWHALSPRETPGQRAAFRLLAGIQVALLYVIMASAVRRMQLYQGEYGQTELRFYTTAFMFWLGVVFAWFVATVLASRRDRFARGAVAAALAAVVVLCAANPDASIAESNLARAAKTGAFDPDYALRLSADAAPALAEGLWTLPTIPRERLAAGLLRRYERPDGDWRAWSWGRGAARAAVSGNAALLRRTVSAQ